ncbi:hypothetical protein B0A53_01439 [Rhodotorula sp. CCFEE 5036]|nr:hypothetical protein B0A53_01439 [Rhodotorula sp. CCFEE 5036]
MGMAASPETPPRLVKKFCFTVTAADDLIKREVFALPSPFPLLCLFTSSTRPTHSAQPYLTRSAPAIPHTTSPYWGTSASWQVEVEEGVWARLRVHDQAKWNKRGQGYLGEITLGEVWKLFPADGPGEVHMTRDLEKGTDNVAVSGRVVLSIRTDGIASPASSPPPLQPTPQLSISTSPSHATLLAHSPISSAPISTAGAIVSTTPRRRLTLAEHRRGAAGVHAIDDALGTPAVAAFQSSPSLDTSLSTLSLFDMPTSPPSLSSSSSSPAAAAVADPLGPLPEGWTLGLTAAGRTYFINHAERKTTWHDPRKAALRFVGWTAAILGRFGSVPNHHHVVATSTGGYNARLLLRLFTPLWIIPHDDNDDDGLDRDSSRLSDLDFTNEPSDGRAYFVDHNVYFRSQPPLRPLPGGGGCRLIVRRSNLFEDAFAEVMRLPAEELKKRLMVSFKGEEGVDFGGVSREFFFLLSHAIFDPSYCLFEPTEKTSYTLQINPNSGINPEHLEYFTFVGRALGMAIFHRRFVDAHFATSIYKACLDRPIGLEDMALVDAEMFRALTWMAENDITDVLDHDFTTQYDSFGTLETCELIPNGAEIPVSESNKLEYIRLLCEHRLRGRVEKQIEALKHGLGEIVPLKELRVFDEKELELLIGGVETIDVDDWEKHTDYRGFTATDPVVQWFWETVKSWPVETKSRLLQFVTGSSRLPVNGFRDLQGSDGPRRFTIEKATGGERGALPKSHTCFNRIDLPVYGSAET